MSKLSQDKGNNVYIGIDPGWQDTAIVGICGDRVVSENIHMKAVTDQILGMADIRVILWDYHDKINRALEKVDTRFSPDNDLCFGIEQPMGARFGNGAKVEWSFATILLVLGRVYIPEVKLCVFTPPQIKKFVTGKGNAKKELIIKEVYKKWGFETDNHNTADAYAVARLVQHEVENDN